MRAKKNSTHGPDFILNVMTLPQAFKRHSDRARIPSYCCKKRQRKSERTNRRGKEGARKSEMKREGMCSAVTSAVETPRWGTEGG